MDITVLLRYFSCALILYCLDAKSISLNDLIAADKLVSHRHQEISNIPAEHLPPPKVLPLFEIPAHPKLKKRRESSNTNRGKNRSLLKYRRTLPIKSPLKTKTLKYLQKPDHKRKNLTTKREIQRRHVKINQKYIPLLRNIELLFDNILSSDSSDTYESRDKYKRNQIASKSNKTCICGDKNESEDSYTQEETNTSTSSPSNEIENASSALTTTAQTDNIIYDNFSRFRRNKNVPILFARNPTSFRRNDTGLSERSSPTYNRCPEGHISWDNGNSKRNAVNGNDASFSENNEKNTNSYSRNYASGVRFTGGIRGIGTNTQTTEINRGASKSTVILPSNEAPKDDTRNISEHKGQMEYQVRGIETESPVFLSEPTPGLRDIEPKKDNIPIRSTEGYEKGIPSNIASDKRIAVRNGEIASENKKIRRTNETIGPKVVMIFDGYSVARDVNGENKMTEKAIHIHS